MPTIRFPSSSIQNSINNTYNGSLFTTATINTNPSVISGSTSSGVSLLLIYKGTIASFPDLTDRATRAADLLISFTISNTSGAFVDDLGIVNNAARYVIGKALTPVAATASGVASWFILCRSGTTSMTDKGALIGSIGLTNSGADLEIPDTNIVSGNNYQCSGFYINYPQNWTF